MRATARRWEPSPYQQFHDGRLRPRRLHHRVLRPALQHHRPGRADALPRGVGPCGPLAGDVSVSRVPKDRAGTGVHLVSSWTPVKRPLHRNDCRKSAKGFNEAGAITAVTLRPRGGTVKPSLNQPRPGTRGPAEPARWHPRCTGTPQGPVRVERSESWPARPAARRTVRATRAGSATAGRTAPARRSNGRNDPARPRRECPPRSRS